MPIVMKPRSLGPSTYVPVRSPMHTIFSETDQIGALISLFNADENWMWEFAVKDHKYGLRT
jgi:hypothetical protein